MHTQPRSRIDLHDRPALLLQWMADVQGQHVHPGDIETDHPGRLDGMGGDLRVHQVGHIGSGPAGTQVGVAAQQNPRPGGRHRIGRQPLFGEDRQGDLVQFDQAEHGGMTRAAARVAIDLGHQLADGGETITDDLGRFAPGGRHHPFADHQQAKVGTRDVALAQDARTLLAGGGEPLLNLPRGAQLGHHTPAVIAIARLHHHRRTQLLGEPPGLLRALYRLPLGHRHARRREQQAGQVLVLGDRFGDGTGTIGLGGPDPALAATPTQLQQVLGPQAAHRDAPGLGGPRDGMGAGTETHRVAQVAEAPQCIRQIEGSVMDGRHQQGTGRLHRGQAQGLLFELDGDPIDPVLIGLAGAAEAHRGTGQGLELEGDMLQDVGHVGATVESLEEPPAFPRTTVVLDQGWQPGLETRVEARDLLGGAVLDLPEVQEQFDRRTVGPDIGSTQDPQASDLKQCVPRDRRSVKWAK